MIKRFKSLCGLLSILVAVGMVTTLFLLGMLSPLDAKNTYTSTRHVTSPVRLALTEQGDLLLSDYQTQTVILLDLSSLNIKRKIDINGRPGGVSGAGGLIYVGNETTGTVEVYTKKGKLHTTFADGSIALPNDIAIDHTTGQIFVVDAAAHHVRVFDAQGQDVLVIPAPGVLETLAYPTALTIDPTEQRVYVSDQGPSVNQQGFNNNDARIRIYNYDGSYHSTLSGDFTRPQGLTINPQGYLYFADGMLGQVLVYDLLGPSLVKTIGSPGTGVGQLLLPLDVVINTENGDLLVASNRTGRIEIFAGGGVAP